jgi:hypothetical protein
MRCASRRSRLAAAVVALVLSSCGNDTSGPTDAGYSLSAVNGIAPPVVDLYPGVPSYAEIVAGTLTLHSDGTVTHRLEVRCPSQVPDVGSCVLTSGSVLVQHGTREGSGVLFDNALLVQMVEASRDVTLVYAYPPSVMTYSVRLDYRR